ncbi:MAG TPA: hypothetical protein VH333_14570 [Pseudonocardiaceae bacterium]|nr:hypothetical protein [Pseudonocardiaceae bacterium]
MKLIVTLPELALDGLGAGAVSAPDRKQLVSLAVPPDEPLSAELEQLVRTSAPASAIADAPTIRVADVRIA